MRLINVKTLELEEFFDADVPPYAILSHTWSDGEVSLNDWNDKRNRIYKPGYQKIARACAEAARDALQYVWADVNCIDKSSSAELSEAINSMFKYYKRSVVCYAYLVDVPWSPLYDCKQENSSFRNSRWFKRGWTLQELIAPASLRFYGKDWQVLGTKVELALAIAETTGVGLWCLLRGNLSKQNQNPLRGYSIAQRLCWASKRSTTRIEDRAYSLLGLFDISMPLVYGEGHNAFERLLEEIVRKYPDQSFLCSQLRYVDFLPRSPKDYDCSQHVVLSSSPRLRKFYTPMTSHPHHFQMTNLGLQITLSLVTTFSADLVFAVLDCWDSDSEINDQYRYISRIWVPLMRKAPSMYSRMLWPQTFFPVRLLPKDVILNQEGSNAGAKPGKDTEDDPFSKAVVDMVSPVSRRNILIKKSFAATVIVKQYQFEDTASPFLICFPREMPGYRPYGIFPEMPDAKEHLHLSLIMARYLNSQPEVDKEQADTNTENSEPKMTHGALIVFRKRNTQPPQFVAVFLANTACKVEATGELTYKPSCRILEDWKLDDEAHRSPEFLNSLGTEKFRGISRKGSVLVAVQKMPVASNRGIQHVGLTQIIFDLDVLRQEVRESANMQQKITANGIWDHFGHTTSDLEDNNLEEESF